MSSACGAGGEAQREGESLGRAEDNAGPGTKKYKPASNAIRLDAGRRVPAPEQRRSGTMSRKGAGEGKSPPVSDGGGSEDMTACQKGGQCLLHPRLACAPSRASRLTFWVQVLGAGHWGLKPPGLRASRLPNISLWAWS